MTEQERQKVNEGLKEKFHPEDDVEFNFETVQQAMEYMREMAADLWFAMDFLGARLDRVEEPKSTKHGSYQNVEERQVAQLVAYYDVKPDAFYEWDT